jgi:PAS domain S-box
MKTFHHGDETAGVAESLAVKSSSHGAQTQPARHCLDCDEWQIRRLLANLPDVALVSDRIGQVRFVSQNIEALTGYTAEELYAVGAGLLSRVIDSEDQSRIRNAYERLFSAQDVFDEKFRITTKGGNRIWLHGRAVPVQEWDGHLVASALLRDITTRREEELRLRAKAALLEALLHVSSTGILVVDEHGNRRIANQRFKEILSVPDEMLVNSYDESLLQYVTSKMKDPEKFLARVKELYANPEETSTEELEMVDGTHLERYTAPVVAEDGTYWGRFWTFRDDTQRKRNEEELRQLSMAVEQSPAIVVITDPRGNITHVNRKFTETTGYLREEVVGKNPRLLSSGFTPAATFEQMWKSIMAGEEWRGEFRNKKKNGELYWESATITPVFNSKGTITHFLALKEDISERRILESQLRQAQKLEGIGQLAAGIAHEINTPTQFVTDNLVFLKESWSEAKELIDKYRESFQAIRSSLTADTVAAIEAAERDADLEFIEAEIPKAVDQSLDGERRVAEIVRAMKEFSHPDSAEKVQVDLNECIRSTITVARNEWKYCAELVTKLDESLPPVMCHPGEINQVILNLIVNGAHAIREKNKNGEKGRITISTRSMGSVVEIGIADSGTGIPEEVQSRIFEPFFTTKDVGKGTGQGLALAHSAIVRKHQGKIWFDTEQGVGTTFFIHLPVGME